MPRKRLACVECNRQQSLAAATEGGGVTELEAQSFGWRHDDKGWHCPFCSGNEDQLRRIFEK